MNENVRPMMVEINALSSKLNNFTISKYCAVSVSVAKMKTYKGNKGIPFGITILHKQQRSTVTRTSPI